MQTLRLVMDAVEHGGALALPGNHDAKRSQVPGRGIPQDHLRP